MKATVKQPVAVFGRPIMSTTKVPLYARDDIALAAHPTKIARLSRSKSSVTQIDVQRIDEGDLRLSRTFYDLLGPSSDIVGPSRTFYDLLGPSRTLLGPF